MPKAFYRRYSAEGIPSELWNFGKKLGRLLDQGLNERLFKFAVEVIEFLRTIKNNQETGIVKYQLTKAATSSGANYSPGQIA